MLVVLLYCNHLVSRRLIFCEERGWCYDEGSWKLMISKCHRLVKDAVLIFWGIPEAISAYSKCCWEFRQKADNNCGLYWHLLHFQSLKIWPPNVELSFFLSGTLFLPKSLLFCLCVRSTDFVANWASTILYAAV